MPHGGMHGIDARLWRWGNIMQPFRPLLLLSAARRMGSRALRRVVDPFDLVMEPLVHFPRRAEREDAFPHQHRERRRAREFAEGRAS